jgi:hypothetical protein
MVGFRLGIVASLRAFAGAVDVLLLGNDPIA